MSADCLRRAVILATVAGLIAVAPAPAQTGPAAPGVASFSWDENPAAVVISYRDVWAELADQDPTPLVRVFGDGRVLVHHPDYTPRAGEYELWLEPAELDSLLVSLLDKGLATVEPAALRRAKASVELGRWQAALAADRSPELFMVADDSTSVFELHLTGYRPVGAAGAAGAALTNSETHRSFSWRGLATDAERYPEIEAIQRLRAAEIELRALVERGDLTRVRR